MNITLERVVNIITPMTIKVTTNIQEEARDKVKVEIKDTEVKTRVTVKVKFEVDVWVGVNKKIASLIFLRQVIIKNAVEEQQAKTSGIKQYTKETENTLAMHLVISHQRQESLEVIANGCHFFALQQENFLPLGNIRPRMNNHEW